MKILSLLAMFLVFPCLAQAAALCERMPLDPEVPAGLEGTYEIIGRDPATGANYAGSLVLASGTSTYAITRTVGGKAVHGDAWVEKCGVDRIEFLVARYDTEPVTRLRCTFGTDGNNYFRATCRSSQGDIDGRGLEAWFQSP